MTPEQIIRGGGILPAGSPVDAGEALDAVRYLHPAMPGRVVVRLLPERLVEGAGTEMALTGFVEAGQEAGVGVVRRRALGFPARALVEDPKNARYALDVMKDFVRARKRIATKPGHARDELQAVAERLGRAAPHFLPSFWEEAGRAFLAGSAVGMAGTAFEKARAAEREHGLPVDEDARADAFLEFAIAGALPVKSILAWPAELEKSQGAAVAYARLYDLAVRRTLGGRAPWASLPKDLASYAKKARRDPAAEEARFVRAVLGATSLKRAPLAFWQAVAGSVAAALQAEPALGLRLLRLFPDLDGDAWLGLLEGWGLLKRLEAEGLDGGLAAWLGRALVAWDGKAALRALVPRLLPRLQAEGQAVPVFGDEVWGVEDVDSFEALLAAGVELACPPDESGRFRMDRWAAGGGACDPVRLAAHPVLGPILERSVLGELDDPHFQAVAPGKLAFREIRRRHLVETLARASAGGLVDFGEALDALESQIPASTRREFPEEAAPAATISALGALARSLRAGLPDELGWPAYDEAVAELTGKKDEVVVKALAPWVVVHDGRRAIVLGPGGREGAFDLKLPKKARPERFRWSGGQLLVSWRDPEDWQRLLGYWSGRPKDELTIETEWGDVDHTPPRAGFVLAGRRILRPGDSTLDQKATWSDAEGVWTRDDEGAFRSVDPDSGKTGPRDAPAALAERDGLRPSLAVYHPQPVPDSPLGPGAQYAFTSFDLSKHPDPEAWLRRHAPGAHRVPGRGGLHCVIRGDGRSWVLPRAALALVRWPGDETPRAVVSAGWRSTALLAADGALVADLDQDSDFTRGSPHPLPLALWHHLRPRDPAASALLRAADEVLAARLLEAAADHDDDDDGRAALADAVGALLPVGSAPLRRGLAGVILHARALQERVEEWRSGAGNEEAEGPSDAEILDAMQGLWSGWAQAERTTIPAIRRAASFLAGEETSPLDTRAPWQEWLPSLGGLVFRAISPATDATQRALLAELVRALVGAFAGRELRILRGKVRPDQGWLEVGIEDGERVVDDLFAAWTPERRVVARKLEEDDDSVELELLQVGPGIMPGFVVESEEIVRVDPALLELLELELPVGDAVYAAIAGPTGLSRGAAALAWAGLRHERWGDPLGKALREALGLKLNEAKAGRDEVRALDSRKVMRSFHEAITGWDRDPASLPARLGAAWAAAFGARYVLEEALAEKAKLDLPGDDKDSIALVATAATAPGLAAEKALRFGMRGLEGEGEGFDEEVLSQVVGTVRWLYANTPGEHPLREAMALAVARTRERLASPSLLLSVARGTGEALVGWFERFEAPAVKLPREEDDEEDEEDEGAVPRQKDRGGLVAVRQGRWVVAAMRPARMDPGDRAEVEILQKLEDNWDKGSAWDALAQLATVDALLADRAPGWAQDPRRSAPGLVAKAMARTGLDEAGATLWLQLLALYNPTKANCLEWNGWKGPTYAAAAAALVEKKLVIVGKRARAGRDHFLPGGWKDRKSGSLPLEEWKLPMYPGDPILPPEPFAALFARAWARVEAGDAPRYERVG